MKPVGPFDAVGALVILICLVVVAATVISNINA
jgi:hypothetical protein